MAINPNWPVVEEGWGPSWTAAGASLPASRWVNVIDRTLSQASARRGKQYELDQAQAGEYSIALGSQDGALDPTNSAGPWGGKILPYQPYRRRAQWPPTANLLDARVATGGEGYAAGTIPAAFGISSTSDSTGGAIAIPSGSLTAYQGANTFRFAVVNGQASGVRICYTDTVAVRPGQTYTVQLRVRNITDSTSVSVKALIGFYGSDSTAGPVSFNYGSTTALTGSSTSNTWTQITKTVTAPTTGGVYGMCVGFSTAATVAANATIEVDAWQVEQASSASAWVSPGTWYPIFSGFAERWPTAWADGGTYGQVSPTAVDAFALLSQVQLKDVFLEEIESHAPRFCYTLADPASSTTFADMTGNFRAAPLVYSKAGTGNWTSGNSVTSSSTGGAYTGSTGTVVNSNPSSPGSATPGSATVLGLSEAGISGPATTAWTRMIAFRYNAGSNPTSTAVIWDNTARDGTNGGVQVYIDSAGHLTLFTNPKNGDLGFSRTFTGVTVSEGNWHLFTIGFDASTLRYSIDGVTTSSASGSIPPLGIPVDHVGADYNPATRTAIDVFKGDLAFVTEFPSLLSSTDISALYTAWKTSASGETSAARYARILRYAGYAGSSNVGTGLTTSMGPADDLAGSDAMSALNGVVTTENGDHFVAADGTITFLGRNARYNALTPSLTFGDASGELPFEDLQLDFDSTHLSNLVTVTQTPTGANFAAQDSASIASYYTRTMTRSLNTTSALESQDAANYLVSRYKAPLTRVQSIKLHPSANTALWASLLALELGTRVRINRRPPGAPLVTVDCFVEQIQWDMDSTNEAWVTLQCSPVDANSYAAFAPFHTTLAGAVSAGGTSVTLNAGADNTNQLASQLPVGTSLIIGLGTANQETVSLTSVGATTSGWTTSACGVSALTKSHSAGDVICEVLPTGVTDATYLDATEQFGKAVFAY